MLALLRLGVACLDRVFDNLTLQLQPRRDQSHGPLVGIGNLTRAQSPERARVDAQILSPCADAPLEGFEQVVEGRRFVSHAPSYSAKVRQKTRTLLDWIGQKSDKEVSQRNAAPAPNANQTAGAADHIGVAMPVVIPGAPAAPIVSHVDLTEEVPADAFCEGLRARWNRRESLAEVVDTRGNTFWQEEASTAGWARIHIQTLGEQFWDECMAAVPGSGRDASYEDAQDGGWR